MSDRKENKVVSSRRRLLKTVGAGALAAGLAGCSGTDEEGTSTGTGTGTETSTNTATETGTPTGGGSGQTAGIEPCLYDESLEDDSCSEAIELSEDITENTTLGADCSEYLVTSSLSVQGGATLTVEGGTKLRFEENTELEVESNSALTAQGSCENPIVFTGDEEIEGFWNGLVFYDSNTTDNILEYCVVEYGGGTNVSTSLDYGANVTVYDGSRVSIDNSRISDSDAYGVLVRDSSDTLVSFENNAVTRNTSGPLILPVSEAGVLATSSTYTGNDSDAVRLRQSTVAGDDDITLANIDVRYLVGEDSNITVQGDLTIDPGTTMSFDDGGFLEIEGSSDNTGRLVADAVEDDQITFTAETETPGYWRGIAFYDTARDNLLTNCVVEYAGSTNVSTSLDYGANISVYRGSSVTISDSEIRDGDAYGVLVRDSSDTLGDFENNTVTGNTSGPLILPISEAGALATSSTYTGNDTDGVHLRASTVAGDEDITLSNIDVRYLVGSSNNITVHGDLTIDPGTTMSFEDGSILEVESGSDSTGRLVADASDGDQITFTGESETAGFWRGIAFYDTASDNLMTNCLVEYGGSTNVSTSLDDPANVTVYRGSNLTINDSTLRESGGWGILVDDSTVTQSNNTFENNALGATN